MSAHAIDVARERAERDARRYDVVNHLICDAREEPGLSMLKALPASERIEALAEAIGQCGRWLVDRRGMASRDSAVHTLRYLSRLLEGEYR